MLAAGCSPRAASASALASSVPPMQKPSVFTWSALVIASATSMRLEHALLDVVVPGQRPLLRAGVAPGHQEDGVALGHRVRDERVRRLQVEDVVLVDARRDDHQRPLVDLVGRRGVLDQLDQLVLEDHGARRGADVAAHLERRLVGHRDAALGQVLGEQLAGPRSGSRRRSPSPAAAPRGWSPGCSPGSARRSPGAARSPTAPCCARRAGAASSALRSRSVCVR